MDKPPDVPTYIYNRCESNGICVTITDSHIPRANECDTPNEKCSTEQAAECLWKTQSAAAAVCKNGTVQVGEYWCCKPAPDGACEDLGDWCDPGECCAGLYCDEYGGIDKCKKKSGTI